MLSQIKVNNQVVTSVDSSVIEDSSNLIMSGGVAEKVEELTDTIDELKKETLLQIGMYSWGKILMVNGIVNQIDDTWGVTEFIRVYKNETVSVGGYSGGPVYTDYPLLCLYDQNKNCVSFYRDSDVDDFCEVELTIPEGVYYMRCQTRTRLLRRSYIKCELLSKIIKEQLMLQDNILNLQTDVDDLEEQIVRSVLVQKQLNAINDLQIDDYVFYNTSKKLTVLVGYDTGGGIFEDEGYRTYQFVTPSECYFYFEPYASVSFFEYLSITVYNTLDYSDVYQSRVRAYAADNALPDAENKLMIPQGKIVNITMPTGSSGTACGKLYTNLYDTNVAIQQNIPIPTEQKYPKVRYSNPGNETAKLRIYIPMTIGYIRYELIHKINQSDNSDCWILNPTYAVDDSYNERFVLTTSGNFECAITISGAPDFMGGLAHGSEVATDIHMFVNGAEMTLSDLSESTNFDELRIVEYSNLYDPRDETTLAAYHGTEYVFTKEKLIINQTVRWNGSFNLSPSYLAMCPTAKSAVNKIVLNNEYKTFDLTQGYPPYSDNVTSVTLWSEANGFSATFSIPRWIIGGTDMSASSRFFVTDNGPSGIYHKCYYIATSGGSVSNNDLWQTTTEYSFKLNK